MIKDGSFSEWLMNKLDQFPGEDFNKVVIICRYKQPGVIDEVIFRSDKGNEIDLDAHEFGCSIEDRFSRLSDILSSKFLYNSNDIVRKLKIYKDERGRITNVLIVDEEVININAMKMVKILVPDDKFNIRRTNMVQYLEDEMGICNKEDFISYEVLAKSDGDFDWLILKTVSGDEVHVRLDEWRSEKDYGEGFVSFYPLSKAFSARFGKIERFSGRLLCRVDDCGVLNEMCVFYMNKELKIVPSEYRMNQPIEDSEIMRWCVKNWFNGLRVFLNTPNLNMGYFDIDLRQRIFDYKSLCQVQETLNNYSKSVGCSRRFIGVDMSKVLQNFTMNGLLSTLTYFIGSITKVKDGRDAIVNNNISIGRMYIENGCDLSIDISHDNLVYKLVASLDKGKTDMNRGVDGLCYNYKLAIYANGKYVKETKYVSSGYIRHLIDFVLRLCYMYSKFKGEQDDSLIVKIKEWIDVIVEQYPELKELFIQTVTCITS